MQTPMEDVREWLEKWECAAKTPQAIVMRCKIILSYLRFSLGQARQKGPHGADRKGWAVRKD